VYAMRPQVEAVFAGAVAEAESGAGSQERTDSWEPRSAAAQSPPEQSPDGRAGGGAAAGGDDDDTGGPSLSAEVRFGPQQCAHSTVNVDAR